MLSSRRLASQSCLTSAISSPSRSDLRSRSAASRSRRSCSSWGASLVGAVLPARLAPRPRAPGQLLAQMGVLVRPPLVRVLLGVQLGLARVGARLALAGDL